MTSTWRTARSLDELLEEVDAAAPDRSRVADGSIGDPAHAARDSDHNPNAAGVVRARDFTHDPADGLDCDRLAERLVELGRAGTHPALGPGAYVIWEGRIASPTWDGRPWDWEIYAGANPHRTHLHLSVATAAAGYDNQRPWRVMNKEDHVNEQDIEKIADRAVEKLLATKIEVRRGDKPTRLAVEQVLRETFQKVTR